MNRSSSENGVEPDINGTGNLTRASVAKIYSFKVLSEDYSLLHDFRPYKKSNDIGLADIVTGEVCLNQSGQGQLIFGEDIA